MTERTPTGADLAVVIVSYDAGDDLTRCVGSLEKHRGDLAIDVLVIDNGSTDGSHLVAKKEHPWIRLVENGSNRYLSPAWNQGAAATDAPLLLFLNPDTEWFRGTLEDLVRVARANPDAGVVGPMVRNPDGTVYPSGRTFPSVVDAVGHAFISPFTRDNPFTRRHELEGWDRSTERVVDWVSGCCMLMPRSAFDEVGGFDEGFPLFAEELDMATRLAARGWRVVFTPEVEIVHEVGASRSHDPKIVRMKSDSMYRYYAKHRAGGWRKITLPLAWVALRARAFIASSFPGGRP
jgi:N-acetylglucosaminyl-diphospho-decaprenol L-rhamnosyltransferase